jgi:tRNA 2-thiouridine synthesizing protein E
MVKELNSKVIDVNEEGYLTDFSQWDRSVAEAIAEEEGISLTDRHWAVVEYLQEQHRNEVPLTIRKLGKSGVTNIKEFYALFPGGPLKKATKIAGIPKPKSCI